MPGAVDPASRRRRRRDADAPAVSLVTGLGAGEWLRLRSRNTPFLRKLRPLGAYHHPIPLVKVRTRTRAKIAMIASGPSATASMSHGMRNDRRSRFCVILSPEHGKTSTLFEFLSKLLRASLQGELRLLCSERLEQRAILSQRLYGGCPPLRAGSPPLRAIGTLPTGAGEFASPQALAGPPGTASKLRHR